MNQNTLTGIIIQNAVAQDNGCLEFRRNLRNGYGRVKLGDKTFSAHRIVLEAIEPAPSKNHKVLHSCDNPCCVNISHLRWGTQKENTQDAIDRGRYVKMVGTTNGRAKLSNEDISEIKRLYSLGQTQRQIGNLFGMSNQMISNIITGKAWKHLDT